MEEPIFSVSEVDGTFCRAGLYDVSAFSSESPSSFESKYYIWLPNGHCWIYAVWFLVSRLNANYARLIEGRVSDDFKVRFSYLRVKLEHLINCCNAIWRLLYWWRSDLGCTFTAGRRKRPWTGQRYHEERTSYQVSPLKLSNVFALGFIS